MPASTPRKSPFVSAIASNQPVCLQAAANTSRSEEFVRGPIKLAGSSPLLVEDRNRYQQIHTYSANVQKFAESYLAIALWNHKFGSTFESSTTPQCNGSYRGKTRKIVNISTSSMLNLWQLNFGTDVCSFFFKKCGVADPAKSRLLRILMS